MFTILAAVDVEVPVRTAYGGNVERMFTIYVDGSAALEPGAATRLLHLAEAGHELVLVAPADHPLVDLATWTGHLRAMPEDPSRGSWWLTADPNHCGDHQPGLRTLLIGPRTDGPRPTRCDTTARDLRDAVLEILAADAMA